MYDRDVVELALLALEEGMSQQEAAELCGASRGTVGYWARGRLPHGRRAPSARPPRRRARMAPPDAKEEPLNEAERAAYEAAMTENQLLRAVLDDLKGAGSHPGSMSNRRKCELGERLRAATGLPLREITAFLRISSSYEYRRARLGRPDKYAALRARVRELFEEGSRNWGYRTVWARLRREGVSGVSATVKSAERAPPSRRRRPRTFAGGAPALSTAALPAEDALQGRVVEVRAPQLHLQRRGALGLAGRDRPARDLPSAELREPDRHGDVLPAGRGQPLRGVGGPHDCPLSGSPSASAASASRSFMR